MTEISYIIEFYEDGSESENVSLAEEYNDTVYGDIIIKVNGSEYYHVSSVLDCWFSRLLEALIVFEYASEFVIHEIENSRYLLSFTKAFEDVVITHISGDKIVWIEKVPYSEFFAEVISAVNRFINELCAIDPMFKSSAAVRNLLAKLEKINNTNF